MDVSSTSIIPLEVRRWDSGLMFRLLIRPFTTRSPLVRWEQPVRGTTQNMIGCWPSLDCEAECFDPRFGKRWNDEEVVVYVLQVIQSVE